jgi:hypothetical protein
MRSNMHYSLPDHADLRAIHKEARSLFHALQKKDVAASGRYPVFDVLEGSSHARLADAQYIIARRYGFKSWANLVEGLNARRANTAAEFSGLPDSR